jgi:hypothetical protein
VDLCGRLRARDEVVVQVARAASGQRRAEHQQSYEKNATEKPHFIRFPRKIRPTSPQTVQALGDASVLWSAGARTLPSDIGTRVVQMFLPNWAEMRYKNRMRWWKPLAPGQVTPTG